MIRKRGAGQYQVRVDLARDEETGRRKMRFVGTFSTKKAADEAERNALWERDHGIAIDPTRATMREFLGNWIETHEVGLKPTTVKGYRGILSAWTAALGSVELRNLRVGHVQSALSRMRQSGLAPQTLLNRYRVLHEALDHAVRWQFIAVNPARGVRAPRVARHEMRIVLPNEVDALLTRFDGDMRRLVRVALGTGLRRGELMALRWSDFDAEAGTLVVERSAQWDKTKGIYFTTPKSPRSRRRISLGADTIAVLREHRAEQLRRRIKLDADGFNPLDLIFCDEIGEAMRPDVITNRFRRAVANTKAAPSPFDGLRLHDLRHSHATLLLLGNTDARTVADRRGHARAGFTLDTYAHPVEEMDRRAAAAIDALLGQRKLAQ